LTDTRAAGRALDGTPRRRVLTELARVYSLTQCFLAYQPAAELVWLAADRAMVAAQEADDPLAIAAAAWYYGAIYREVGQSDRALTTALDAPRCSTPPPTPSSACGGLICRCAPRCRRLSSATPAPPGGTGTCPIRRSALSTPTTATFGCRSAAPTWTGTPCGWKSV
jgi:hypothetical protein